MPSEAMGGFGPMNDFPAQDGEGKAMEGEGTPNAEALTQSSLNAKKQNPYGPCWPGLAEILGAK